MARIAFLLLCFSCSLVDGYRKKRAPAEVGHGVAHSAVNSNVHEQMPSPQNNQEAAALLERAHDASEEKTKSLNLEQSALGKNPRRRHPPRRRRAPPRRRRALPAFKVIGSGKCLSCGQDPRHIYKHGNGPQCESLCRNDGSCCAYSTSGFNNCLIWTQCEGLTAGGGDWAGAKCHVKPGFENIPCPTPQPTPQPTPPPTPQPTTPQPTAEPTEPPCPSAVQRDPKTQECITMTPDFETVVVRSECCGGVVADKLIDDGANDVDEEDDVIEGPGQTARLPCSSRPCGQCSLPCHVRYSEIPSDSQQCATCDEPPSVCAQRSWSQCTDECKRTYTDQKYAGCAEA